MLYLTCTMISSVDLAHYGVSRAKDWVSVHCGTSFIGPDSSFQSNTTWSVQNFVAVFFLTHWTRISGLSTGVLEFSIPACYLSIGSLKAVSICQSLLNITQPTQFVTCHVNFMQNMELTPSDVQEMSQ